MNRFRPSPSRSALGRRGHSNAAGWWLDATRRRTRATSENGVLRSRRRFIRPPSPVRRSRATLARLIRPGPEADSRRPQRPALRTRIVPTIVSRPSRARAPLPRRPLHFVPSTQQRRRGRPSPPLICDLRNGRDRARPNRVSAHLRGRR